MYTKLNASRAYVYVVARACDQGKVSRRVSFFSAQLCHVDISLLREQAMDAIE